MRCYSKSVRAGGMLSVALLAPRHLASQGSLSAIGRKNASASWVGAAKSSFTSPATKLVSRTTLQHPLAFSSGFRYIHSRNSSESLYDFEKPGREEPKRRKSSSDSKSSRSSRPTRLSRDSPSSTSTRSRSPSSKRDSTSASSKKSRSPPKTYVRKQEPIEEPESAADLRRYRREAEAIEYTPISSHPKISMTQVSFSSPKYKDLKQERYDRFKREKEAVSNYHIMPTVIIDGLNPDYGVSTLPLNVGIRPAIATDDQLLVRAKAIADQLSIPYIETAHQARLSPNLDFCLVVGENHIGLANLQEQGSPIVFSDFIGGPTAYRKATGGSDPKSPIMKALTISGKSINETHIVDATGGLGVDGFMFASAGFNVTMLEKNPLVYTLLSDAVQRASQVPGLKSIMSRITIQHIDAVEWFAKNANNENTPDVIFLDPMYPIESKMKALPKKGMALARALVGRVDRADALVREALNCAKEKVVLKRPYYTVESAGVLNSYKSRSLRFEVFTRDSWEKAGNAEEARVPANSQRIRPQL